jgi:hypothetical protein
MTTEASLYEIAKQISRLADVLEFAHGKETILSPNPYQPFIDGMRDDASPADFIVEHYGETRAAADEIVRNCSPQEFDPDMEILRGKEIGAASSRR